MVYNLRIQENYIRAFQFFFIYFMNSYFLCPLLFSYHYYAMYILCALSDATFSPKLGATLNRKLQSNLS